MKSKLNPLYLEKLMSSGIESKHAQKLGYSYLSAEQTERLGHLKIPALKIPYFDIKGKATKFYRIRYLESTKKGMLALTDSKEQRYDQPSGASPEVYLPPLISWEKFFAGESPLIITEGELKAACATISGYPTIGLGGVWNFCSRKNGVALLPIFNQMELKGRDVYIIYDSDSVSNPQVIMAENELCRQLMAKGATPLIVRLPPLEGAKKVGLDDFLTKNGDKALEELILSAAPFKLAQELFALNEEVIYIENPSLVLRLKDRYKMGVPTFKNEVFAHRSFLDLSGEKPKKVKTAEEWIKWEGRSCVNGFTYEPGQPEYIVHGERKMLNMWQGLPIKPKRGDIKPWKDLMDYVFHNDPAARKWFEQWLAYPLQHLGTKLFTAAVVWSVATGTGKTLIGHTIQRLYGTDNSIMIRKRDLASGNNSFAENKQFIVGEEITGDEKRALVDELKSLITNEELRINIKYVPEYSVRSCANYYFTSNNPDAFSLDETDRRFFIHEIIGDPLPEQWYTGTYDPWYKSDDGAAALLYHLLHVDTTDFNPMSRAPMTVAKQNMIEDSLSNLAGWVKALRDTPDTVLRVGDAEVKFDLYSANELLALYDPTGKGRAGVRAMGVELKRARFIRAAGGMPCRVEDGQKRLWVVRNADKYKGMSQVQVGAAYDKERKMEEKRKSKFTKKGGKDD